MLRVTNSTLDMARRALRCFQALHALGMECDLVLICELSDGYQRGGLDDLKALAQLHGGAYVLEGAELSDDERALLREVAAAYIDDADDAMRRRQRRWIAQMPAYGPNRRMGIRNTLHPIARWRCPMAGAGLMRKADM